MGRVLAAMAATAAALMSAPAAHALGPKSTGGDYMEAAGAERRAWQGTAAGAIGESTTPGYAEALGECLESMLTVAGGQERSTVAMLRKSELAGLTALCASGLSTNRRR